MAETNINYISTYLEFPSLTKVQFENQPMNHYNISKMTSRLTLQQRTPIFKDETMDILGLVLLHRITHVGVYTQHPMFD